MTSRAVLSPTLPRETVEHVVRAACLAPSVHNTQPWRFTSDGHSLDLYADRTRQLAAIDPTGRQLHLSCGAAVHHARIAARALGLDVEVVLLPDPRDGEHLARLHLATGRPANARDLALADAVLERHTHRGGFDPLPVGEQVLEALRLAVDAEGAALRQVTEEEDLLMLEVLLSRADQEQARDPLYAEELSQWTGAPDDAVEGVPARAAGDRSGFRSSLTARAFPGEVAAAEGATLPVEHPTVAVLVTARDDPHDWLVAGQALGALLLSAASYSVLAQPLGQVTDLESSRQQLRHTLGLTGHPQLVLRLGHVSSGGRLARRRPVAQVLSFPAVQAG